MLFKNILVALTQISVTCSTANILVYDEDRELLHDFCNELGQTGVSNAYYGENNANYILIDLVIKSTGSISFNFHYNQFNQITGR